MRMVHEAIPVTYEGGLVTPIGEPASSDDIAWIEKTGYEVVECGMKGWGQYNCIISVQHGMESYTYLALVSEELLTGLNLIIPKGLRTKLAAEAYEEGKSETEITRDALDEYFNKASQERKGPLSPGGPDHREPDL